MQAAPNVGSAFIVMHGLLEVHSLPPNSVGHVSKSNIGFGVTKMTTRPGSERPPRAQATNCRAEKGLTVARRRMQTDSGEMERIQTAVKRNIIRT